MPTPVDSIDPRIRTALVTGSARRTGRAMALWLAARGVRVAVHYRGSETEAEETRAECDTLCKGAIKLQGDLTDAAQAARVVEQAASQLGGLHLLVNNVGNYLRRDLFELTPEEWRDQLESNLYTAWWCMRAAVPVMRAQGFGRVVNLGYAAGERPTYNRLTVPYHIAKTGLATLTRSAAAAVAKQGITVNTIGVGILENSIIKPVNPPAGRFAGFEDICNALGFFLLPQSDHINGSQLDINGGWIPEQIL
ncbi:MAG: SDR family oxidoreductase [Planctomycetes bacterium]|jgi:NAD(P)-dependent dehydrogenase (short-subunit alcohol dehydrogenase family)|nr:SDR family oxidoreductase [Planctomycetota bacterium]